MRSGQGVLAMASLLQLSKMQRHCVCLCTTALSGKKWHFLHICVIKKSLGGIHRLVMRYSHEFRARKGRPLCKTFFMSYGINFPNLFFCLMWVDVE